MGGAGVSSPRTWSMNTWLIAICVVVFMADSLSPPRWVPLGVQWTRSQELIDESDLYRGDWQRAQYPSVATAPIRQGQQGDIVGYQTASRMGLLSSWLHFSTQRGFLGFQFWRFIGFQFLHANVSHLLFNMIGLYFFGPLVERYLGSKRYLAFYLLSGIAGATMYLILNLGGVIAGTAVPGLLVNDTSTPLVGASAGVFGVLMAGAFLAPHATVLLFFIIPMALRTLAYALVVIAFISVVSNSHNAGGEAGHLGGALAGWYFIRHPKHLHNFFDVVGWLDPTSHHYKGDLATRARAVAKIQPPRRGPSRAEIDRILDKVHQEGLASLSEKEKQILRDASEKGS